ncbi:hypothetical protein J5N97_023563 [Dioscorea zingiberensis]|uniref:cinnamyl-alcohol dehydrogenase n=1 Tax=Dioscorea zingiberensis TaxID=325984 RepID=A0A9D5H7Y2_9LILI|nr:hypothetical protein J5N97_023563 [Dioscorea zingiberensis]
MSLSSEEHPQPAFGWAARDSSGLLSPFNFSRRVNGENDITIKIFYCGICHTDLHFIRNAWNSSSYPMVPGHEIVGIVTQVGSKVQKFKAGDKAAVGCVVGACHACPNCEQSLEIYCSKSILTYNSTNLDGTRNHGGYSDNLVVNERYAVLFPETLPMDSGAPLMCAGITVYSPMKYFGLSEPGKHVGVVGLGGLGHVAVKFAKAFGVKVTVISTSPAKQQEAIHKFGADSFLVSTDEGQIQAAVDSMDGILDTVSGVHSISPLISLLKAHGKLILLGAPEKPFELPVFPLLMGRKMVVGSACGGMKETQEMIDFAGKHNITADIELISMDYVNTAMERLARGDVRYRFVIDIANTLLPLAHP